MAVPARLPLLVCLLAAGMLALRTSSLDAGYWIDEAIAVGIASRDLADIPWTLRMDGSPPLYYLLLHGWMALVGTGEAATRSLSLLFAIAAVPVAWWAGRALSGPRAAALAAAGAAGCPFLTHYAQETRMYSLVAVLSLLTAASFALAFLRGRRRHVPLTGLWLVLLLYTHTWGVFLAAGMAAAWLVLWRRGRVDGREGALLAGGVLALYAPWLPTVLFQATHTAAPWAGRPPPAALLAVPGAMFGYAASALLLVAVLTARRGRDDAVRALAVVVVVTAAVAWLCSQVQPAWSPRYLAVLFGPLLLALAATLSRGTRWTALLLAAVAAVWVVTGQPTESNARAVAGTVASELRAGDLVVSTQPEQVPVLARYLPEDAVYVTPLGVAADPKVTDWRDGVARLRAGRSERVLEPLLDGLTPGRRVLLVTPAGKRSRFAGPWTRIVRRRTAEWRATVRAHPRLRLLRRGARPASEELRAPIRFELYEAARRTATPDS